MIGYPAAPRRPVTETLHRHRVTDSYRWLEDDEHQDTVRWLGEQRILAQRHLDEYPGRAHFTDLVQRLSDVDLPTRAVGAGGRAFLLDDGKLRVIEPDGTRRLLLDPGTHTLGRWCPSPDGELLAYQVSHGGKESGQLRVLEVSTGRQVGPAVDGVRRSPVAWLPDGSGFCYVRRQDRPAVFLRRISPPHGQSGVDEPLFAEQTVAAQGVSLRIDQGRWLVLRCSVGVGGRTDVWLVDLATADLTDSRPVPVARGVAAGSTAEVAADGLLYLLTDLGDTGRRLCRADPRAPDRWHELIPADPDTPLVAVALAGAPPLLLVVRAGQGRHELAVHDPVDGARLREVALNASGQVGSLHVADPRLPVVSLVYTDFVTPPHILRCDLRTGSPSPEPAAVSGCLAVHSKRVRYRSVDGTEVSMTLLGSAGVLRAQRPVPTLLSTYGGFGVPTLPSYQPDLLAWLNSGGVVALPAVRGGGDAGRRWHQAAVGTGKQRSVDDLLAAADWLVRSGHTTPDRLALLGSSNGGLLVGAALTQRPELFAAAACLAPVLDMARYERFGLGPAWRAEYGSVAEPAQCAALLAYSPYHRVADGSRYPAVLFVSPDDDTRVHPLHARKMCAALQHADPDGAPILFRALPGIGHATTPAPQAARICGEYLAFLAAHTGLDYPAGQP